MPRGIGSRCGVNVICVGCKVQLLQQLAGVAMAEDPIGGEIVCRVHEMRLRGGLLARAGDAGLGVADDAAIEVNPAGGNQRLEARG